MVAWGGEGVKTTENKIQATPSPSPKKIAQNKVFREQRPRSLRKEVWQAAQHEKAEEM